MNDEKAIAELRNKLMGAALRRGVRYQDAEDLVSVAILKGLHEYDSTRGDFSAFCHTILLNRIKNHWRGAGRHPHEEYIDDRYGSGWESTPESLERNERMEATRSALNKILKKLTLPEREFYEAYLAELQDSDVTLVAKAAARIGISLQEAHNIFRRIQRKAKNFRPPLEEAGVLNVAERQPARHVLRLENKPVQLRAIQGGGLFRSWRKRRNRIILKERTENVESAVPVGPAEETSLHLLTLAIVDAGFRSASLRRFTSSLSAQEMARLQSLLN